MKELLILSIVLFCIYICLSIIDTILNYVRVFNFWRRNKSNYGNLQEEVKEDYEPVSANTGYNTHDFKNRMAAFKKEYYDGVPLYDLPEAPTKKDDFTGVEVITPEYEAFMDKRLK